MRGIDVAVISSVRRHVTACLRLELTMRSTPGGASSTSAPVDQRDRSRRYVRRSPALFNAISRWYARSGERPVEQRRAPPGAHGVAVQRAGRRQRRLRMLLGWACRMRLPGRRGRRLVGASVQRGQSLIISCATRSVLLDADLPGRPCAGCASTDVGPVSRRRLLLAALFRPGPASNSAAHRTRGVERVPRSCSGVASAAR